MKRITLSASLVALCAAMTSCAAATTPEAEETIVTAPEVDEEAAEIAEATAFVARAEAELAALSKVTALAYWANETNITDETDAAVDSMLNSAPTPPRTPIRARDLAQ